MPLLRNFGPMASALQALHDGRGYQTLAGFPIVLLSTDFVATCAEI